MVFGRSGNCSRIKKIQWDGRSLKDYCTFLEENTVSQTHIDWKETFKRAYIGIMQHVDSYFMCNHFVNEPYASV